MQNKRVFITGGASGLGKAIAEKFAATGYRVCIGDINESQAALTLKQLQSLQPDAFFIPCDVRQLADIEKAKQVLIEQWNGVDVVVNNAGVAGTLSIIEEVPMQDWAWIVDINLMGIVRGCKTFTPLFKAQNRGYFVNIASAAGLLNVPNMANYNVTKAAVISLSETLRAEFSEYKDINVSVVCPGFFPTNLSESIRSNDDGTKQRIEKIMQRTGITAEYVANEIFEAIKTKSFWVLPHKLERRLWVLKRYFPEVYFQQMVKKIRKRLSSKKRGVTK